MNRLIPLYHDPVPPFLAPVLDAPELLRLRDVGMNCGCEYTAFPRFRGLAPYSRYDHSLGCALIVWRFTSDPAQSIAALLHDIATPAFAHAIDFMHGDYLVQESTEARTGAMIRGSSAILGQLKALGLTPEYVEDYHRYPIADNDSPRLSADRLEYTLGNLLNFGLRTEAELGDCYRAIVVGQGEDGAPELAFSNVDAALNFATGALECSKIYVSNEDRWSMQMAAELVAAAIARGVLREDDLYDTEPSVIARLESDPQTSQLWRRFRRFSQMASADSRPEADRRVVPAKKRVIDPLVAGRGRLSALCPEFGKALAAFRAAPLDAPICAL